MIAIEAHAMYEEQSSRMIRWLERQSPDAWHSAALNLNWDFAEDVIHWIVEQPECDKATAAYFFWLGNPDEYVNEFPFDGKAPEGFDLFSKIVERWKAGRYGRCELKWDDPTGSGEIYRSAVEDRDDGRDPFDLPEELFTPHDGREVPNELRPEYNAELRELLHDLGTHVKAATA